MRFENNALDPAFIKLRWLVWRIYIEFKGKTSSVVVDDNF